MGVLDSLSPGQRKLVTYGVPAVVALVLANKVLHPAAPTPEEAAAPTVPPQGVLPASDANAAALAGAFSDFTGITTAALNGINQRLEDLATGNISLGATDDELFLSAAYQGIFGRPPDVAGENYWEAQLAAGASRSYVLNALTAAKTSGAS